MNMSTINKRALCLESKKYKRYKEKQRLEKEAK